MSQEPYRMSLRDAFSVDVSTSGVQVTGIAPETVSFTSVQMTPPPGGSPPVPPAGGLMTQPPPAPAGYWEMAQSFTSSVAQFAASGFRTVDESLHAQRLAQCNGCESHTGTRCVLCGCFTAAKAWMPHETCPLGKWPQ